MMVAQQELRLTLQHQLLAGLHVVGDQIDRSEWRIRLQLPKPDGEEGQSQTVLPSAETAAMLFWALLASGQITMHKVDGWQSLAERPSDQTIDLAE